MVRIIDYHEYVPRRKALGPGFSNTNLKVMEPILHKNIDTFNLKVKTELEEKGKIEIYYWLELAITNILGVCYGKDFGLIDIGGHDDFIKSLFTALFTYTARGKTPFIGLVEYLLSYIPHSELQWLINSNNRLTARGLEYVTSRFKPERWENPTKAMETALMPFGGLSRLCPAKNLAMMKLRLIAAKVVKECGDMTPADSCTDESLGFEELTALLPKTHKCEFQRKLPVPMAAR
ncbi:hypothetical protein TWF106_009785 [Orbilia oligospora]|nr:hypothetical protein TWF106_009785 [Orbilia oligospora]